MSYEDKINDLLERLVAMTPDPPPNPEEITMTRREAVRRPRPALMFAGAAAMVAALAVPILLFTGGGSGNVADSTSTTLASPTTTRVEVGVTWSGYVFVYQMPQNSFKQDPALVPMLVAVDIEGGDQSSNFTDALAEIERDNLLPDPYQNAIPPEVRVLTTSTNGTVITAEMNAAFVDGAGGLLADFTMLNQLIYTLTIGDASQSVLFNVNGEPVSQFGTDGLDLTGPVDRNTFIENLALIFVTELSVSDNGLLVAGTSNTFEASMAMALLDSSGNVVEEQFIQATSGSGTWGTYEATVSADLITPGESVIRLYSYSAQDGEGQVDLIEISIPADGVWNFTGR